MKANNQLRHGSQNQRILHFMRRGRAITPLSALRLFRALRLGGRIHELRGRGHKIKTVMISLGNRKRVASYFMPSAKR